VVIGGLAITPVEHITPHWQGSMQPQLLIHTSRLAVVANSDIRKILARMVLARASEMDLYSRLSMLEGLLNKPQGSLTRSSGASAMTKMLEDVKGQLDPSSFQTEKEFERFFDPKLNLKFPLAVQMGVNRAAKKVPQWIGPTGRMDEEEIFSSLVSGLTLGTSSLANGGNIFRRTGLSNKGRSRWGIGGLFKSLKDNAYKASISLVPRNLAAPLRGDATMDGTENSPSLLEQQESTYTAPTNNRAFHKATPRLQRVLSDSQWKLWNVILSDPDLILYGDKLGLAAGDAARAYRSLHGDTVGGSTLAKTWKRMAPVVLDIMEDDLVSEAMARGRRAARIAAEYALQQTVARVASRFLEACGDEPCATCEGCGCGGTCDGSCGGNEEAMMEKTSPALGTT
jgi:hypothetical protein